VESHADQASHCSDKETENWYGEHPQPCEPGIVHRLWWSGQSFQLAEASDASFQQLDIETPAVSELRAERVRFSAEQLILLIARWQRVSFVSSDRPKDAFELRLESMFVEEEEN
jgi:hypothetical protein